MRTLLFIATTPLLAAMLPAQHIILMTTGGSAEQTVAFDPPEIDLISPHEIYEVQPGPGFYTARPFMPVSLQWIYSGDQDNDGLYVEAQTDGPGLDIDAIHVKRGTVGPVTPRQVFFSIAAASPNLPGVLPSDVVRYSGQGVREVFLTQAQLETGTGGTSLNLDALAQSAAGDLFLSFSLTEMLPMPIGSVDDGDLIMIPAAAITYDAQDNVSAIAPNSAVRVASQDDLIAMVNFSGFRTSVGGTVTTSFELSGLEMDPNGGTFVAPADPTLVVPNLLFCWSDFSNDGAIISTANGGTFAVINGVPMASAIATQGDQIGWLPNSTGTFGPGGLALIPAQPPAYAMQNYPRNLHTAGSGQTLLQFQVSGGTPGGASIIGLSIESSTPGGAFPSFSVAPVFVGEFNMTAPVVIGFVPHDSLGNCTSQFLIFATAPLSGTNAVAQALDFANLRFSTAAGLSFQ